MKQRWCSRSCIADRYRVGLTDPHSRDLGVGGDMATASWSVRFVDGIKKAPDSASRVRALDTRGKDLIHQLHVFIPGPDGHNWRSHVTEGGARAWHMFSGIGAVDEALHIKCGCPMSAEFASEIGGHGMQRLCLIWVWGCGVQTRGR